ncbi:hypothetical protein BD779DRAFT_1500014 [Infundibulicybe gibba]|nr:hypothetical protein BD779DRAFT_1500014 [Infundibulicybe gibba]
MGGSAFSSKLSSSAFPRMPPVVYQTLKARFLPVLHTFYKHVVIPVEAPGKPDHGDLDFVVVGPLREDGTSDKAESMNVPHARVAQALGASVVIPMEGNRTSNFAVPVSAGEWARLGCAQAEERGRDAAPGRGIFYQVDVHVCEDKDEWERIRFFHAYGDLGMILGLIANNAGLALGVHGLRVPDPPHPPMPLSTSFPAITSYMGLSMAAWEAGFTTQRAVFEWAASCRFFAPGDRSWRFEGTGISKVKKERTMYAAFVEWARAHASENRYARRPGKEEIRREALVHFGKADEFDARVRERERRVLLKNSFSGPMVREWAGMGEHWKGVKAIMDEVRDKLGGDVGVSVFLTQENGQEKLKDLVLRVRDEMGFKL